MTVHVCGPPLAIALRLTTGFRRIARIREFSLQGLPRSSPPLYIYREPISGKQHGLCLFPAVRTASSEGYLVLWHQPWTTVHARAVSWLQMAWVISQSRRSNSCNKSLSWGNRSLRGLKRNRFLKALFWFYKYHSMLWSTFQSTSKATCKVFPGAFTHM